MSKSSLHFIHQRKSSHGAAASAAGRQIVLRMHRLNSCWRIVFSTFLQWMTFHTACPSEADLSTQARVKADYEFTAQPKLGNGRGALERRPRKQALTIGRGAGTEQRGVVGLSHVVERIADRNVGERHPPRHQEVTTLQPLLE